MAIDPHAIGLDVEPEAQRLVPQPVEIMLIVHEEEVRGSETLEMGTFQPYTSSVASQSLRVSTGQDVGNVAQPVVSQAQAEENGESNDYEIDIDQSESGSQPNDVDDYIDSEPEEQLEEKCLIGDFDGSANTLWALYGKEAKSYDDARINTLKDDMDGVLIFAGLFSAALTTFVNDSVENLQVKPQDEIVYYLRQQSSILAQISQQLSSIAPQVSIPSTPPPPFPEFNPSSSDIRINVFWFMSLIFSLLAALFAILVQQWVRDYMHVFQQYSDPLKSARLRQYLYEGSKGWYMPVVAEAVPGLLHFSLFLFLIGLGDSLLSVNATVGLSTIVPIGIGGLLYIFTILAPILYPQSPYRNSFSGIIWYLFQKLRGRRYKERGLDGVLKSVSADMAQGQMQLAMEETEERKSRDGRAILWLVDTLTEHAEMEQFLMTIPGSFNTNWGAEVWKNVGNIIEESRIQKEPIVGTLMDPQSDIAYIQGKDIVHELSSRVSRFLETSKNRRHFANEDSWRRCTRAYIETTASLVLCANAKLAWFGDITKLLEDIGSLERTRESSEKGMDQLFVIRWSCLSLVAIRQILEDDWNVRSNAGEAVTWLTKADHDTSDNPSLTRVEKADKTLQNAAERLRNLYNAMTKTENVAEAKETLRDHESEILELERINIEADGLEDVDQWMFNTQSSIAKIISQFPGIRDGDDLDPASVRFSHFVEQFCDPQKVQFILPGRTLKRLCLLVPTLRDVLDGQGNDVNSYQDMFNDLGSFVFKWRWQGDELQRQLSRMQDLCNASEFGFTVELFFLALQQLSSTSSSPESHSTLYVDTLRAITSDWSKYKDSVGTQKILLDIVETHGWEFDLPGRNHAFIANEFLVLLGNVFEGQTGLHIDGTVQRLSPDLHTRPRTFRAKALRVITRAQTPSS